MFDGVMKLLVKGYGPGAGSAVREKSGKAAGAVGIATNLLLFAIKMAAGLLSGSVAIMADAVNNLTDSGSSIIMLVGLSWRASPPTPNTPSATPAWSTSPGSSCPSWCCFWAWSWA